MNAHKCFNKKTAAESFEFDIAKSSVWNIRS